MSLINLVSKANTHLSKKFDHLFVRTTIDIICNKLNGEKLKKPVNTGFNGPLVFFEPRKVGTTRFELATPCTPCKCATGLRHAPTEGPNDSPKGLRELELRRPSAAKDFDQLFQFEPHLMNELLALIEIHLRVVAGQ